MTKTEISDLKTLIEALVSREREKQTSDLRVGEARSKLENFIWAQQADDKAAQ